MLTLSATPHLLLFSNLRIIEEAGGKEKLLAMESARSTDEDAYRKALGLLDNFFTVQPIA